jgi:hypothetical protein
MGKVLIQMSKENSGTTVILEGSQKLKMVADIRSKLVYKKYQYVDALYNYSFTCESLGNVFRGNVDLEC